MNFLLDLFGPAIILGNCAKVVILFGVPDGI